MLVAMFCTLNSCVSEDALELLGVDDGELFDDELCVAMEFTEDDKEEHKGILSLL